MILNLILYNETTITVALIVCCLFVLAGMMIPKARKHRKQVKQNESEKTVPDQGQEVQTKIVPGEEALFFQSMADYKRRFITNINEPGNRKLVGIRTKYHKRISKIVEFIGEDDVTIFSYMDNVLKHHFETFQDEISAHYKRKCDDDYLIPKR